jgi:hypothetical protein
MMAVGMSYAVASEFMPAFEESARFTAVLACGAMFVMAMRRTNGISN